MTNSEKLKAIANTLETLIIPATGENVSKLTGIYQILNQVIRELAEEEDKSAADDE